MVSENFFSENFMSENFFSENFMSEKKFSDINGLLPKSVRRCSIRAHFNFHLGDILILQLSMLMLRDAL